MTSTAELSTDIVEQYLDNNYEFAKSYFERKATSSMVDQWMASRSHRPGSRTALHVSQVKKESLPGNVLKPLARVNLAHSVSDLHADDRLKTLLGEVPPKTATLRKSELLKLDERQLFMELIRDISNELDINRLSHKILVNVSILTNADRCSLFLVRGSKDHKVLVSKLFDVTSDSTVEEAVRSEDDEIVVPFGVGIAGHTARTGETINIPDAYSDSRFNAAVDKSTGYKTHSILCLPIKSHEGEVIGVAQIINKITGEHQFTPKDEEVFKNYLTFCGIGITNAQLFEISVQEYKRNQVLLQLARGIFEEQTNLDGCVYKIMLEAQELIACERCMVFLIDESIHDEVVFSKAFDLVAGNEEEGPSTSSTHWSLNTGISAIVASTGQGLNIPDAYADPRFNQEADEESGFRTKTILCMPIYNREQKIVGVAQLLNKLDNKPFTDADENLFEAFAIFCGLGIHNTMMYEQACKLLAKQTVAMEVLSYHATAQPNEVDKIMKHCTNKQLSVKTPPVAKYNLSAFEFSDFELSDNETVLSALVMFMELDILNLFHVSVETMVRWLLSVKKNYRAVIYHNWRHAFNVAQTMFVMLTTGKMDTYFSDLEKYSLLVACLCHDLDHRGTNNAFQSKIDSPLATLYGTSTMEHHHFDHSIMILNSEGNNIFSELSPEEYRKAIKLLEHAILSTDLAIYFKKRGNFEKICHSKDKDFQNDDNREVLRAMMMTACDVAAICKPWEIQQKIADLVASEFFEQGDIEREQLHEDPIPMMDRKKKDELPKMQVGFIDFICMSVYKLFAELQPELIPLYKGCSDNRDNWQRLHEERQAANRKEDAETKQKEASRNKKPDQGTIQKAAPQSTKESIGKEIQPMLKKDNKNKVKEKTKKSKTCSIF